MKLSRILSVALLSLLTLSANVAEARRGVGGLPGSGGGSAPGAPPNVQVINQGGLNAGNTASTSYYGISWTPSTPGSSAVTGYPIYRNGAFQTTVTSPVGITGYIAPASGQPYGGVLTVTAVSGGSGGQVIPNMLLVSNSGSACTSGLTANSRVYQQLTGSLGSTGTYSVNFSQTTCSSGSPGIFQSWVYADTGATANNDPTWATPATIYKYGVEATDGTLFSAATNASLYLVNGISQCDRNDLSYGGGTVNYNDTTWASSEIGVAGPYDVQVPGTAAWQPAAGSNPANSCAPVDTMEVGAFTNWNVDILIVGSISGAGGLDVNQITRTTDGDTQPWGSQNLLSYCTPVINTWVHCSVPLSDLNMGLRDFTGAIAGTGTGTATMTVSAVSGSGPGLDGGGFITGVGVPSGTFISAYSQSGSIGTFTLHGPGLSGATSIGSETMHYQRTSFYKGHFQWGTGPTNVYFNNEQWTP